MPLFRDVSGCAVAGAAKKDEIFVFRLGFFFLLRPFFFSPRRRHGVATGTPSAKVALRNSAEVALREVTVLLVAFFGVLPGFTGFYRVLPGYAGFHRVLLGFNSNSLAPTGFQRVFHGFYWFLLGSTGFQQGFTGFHCIYWVSTGFYRILLFFFVYYWVSPSFNLV